MRSAPALVLGVGCAALYGAAMGLYPLFAAAAEDPLPVLLRRAAWQATCSGVKLPLLLAVTFLLSVPSFFVFNSLLGLRDDFPAALAAVARTQAAVGVVLGSLAPYMGLWYAGSGDYTLTLLYHAAVLAGASGAGQLVLWRRYRPLIARDGRHRLVLWAWLATYAFVGIQMGWTLRPFVGAVDRPVTFFRDEPFGNAYVVVFGLLADAAGWD